MRKALCLLICLFSGAASAQFEDIQNPGTVSAVQERTYRMNHEITLSVGVLPLDAFYKGIMAQVAYTAHFSDSFAWQVGRAMYSYNLDTGLRNQLEQSFGASPVDFDEVQYAIGSDLVWSPIYGKTTFLNSSVKHFEVYLLGGGSIIRLSRAGFRPALDVGIGARLFSSKVLSFRLDVTDNIVIAPDRAFLNVMTVSLAVALNFGATE